MHKTLKKGKTPLDGSVGSTGCQKSYTLYPQLSNQTSTNPARCPN